MTKTISLDQFRIKSSDKDVEAPTPRSLELPAMDDWADLTKAGQDFRRRFIAALEDLKIEAATQLASAKKRSDVKARITVAAIATRAKSSRLGAYSPLHRDVLIPLVEAASFEHQRDLLARFKVATQRKSTVSSLTAQLKAEREEHAKAMSTLASQKLSMFLSLR